MRNRRSTIRILGWSRVLLWLAFGASSFAVLAGGAEVVVVFNSQMPESQDVASHYAAVRHVPTGQVIGLKLPITENMTRAEYREQLQRPLLDFLETNGLFTFRSNGTVSTGNSPAEVLVGFKVRYAVLCFGVPLRILDDPQSAFSDPSQLPQPMRGRNGAAVDSELTMLPLGRLHYTLDGPSENPLFAAANALLLNPMRGVLMVTRLDGPSAAVAWSLVDKAMEAETNGLWGRAYFDLRGLTDSGYKKGDDQLGGAAAAAGKYGFETEVDHQPQTFPAEFPMSQIALYAGWYDSQASGPFTRPNVEFMPGAFAYHLHSFSAHTLRSTNQYWCGPLLTKGVTATMGCVDEPYLDGTPNMEVFFNRWLLQGFTFGEAACAAQPMISWQTTVVGDPLYRPAGSDARNTLEELEKRGSPLVEWSALRIVNINLSRGGSPAGSVRYLEDEPATKHSVVLMEKLAALYWLEGKPASAFPMLRLALASHPTPQTRVRLTLTLAEQLASSGDPKSALDTYDEFLKSSPDYPGALALWRKMEVLARKTGDSKRAERYAAEVRRLTPHP